MYFINESPHKDEYTRMFGCVCVTFPDYCLLLILIFYFN